MRIGCLFVVWFPLAARLRSEPDLRGEAVAVTTGDGDTARIVAAIRRARRAGVRRDQTLSQARALLPRLLARARDPECERAARESLVESARGVSPRVEDAGEGLVFLDLQGLERHFEDEESLGRHLVAAAEEAGLPARAGIAGSKLVARVAAVVSPGSRPAPPVTVVPPGQERAFLAPVPVSCLRPRPETARILSQWGIESVGDLARLPRNEAIQRLGGDGRRLQAMAHGEDPSPLVPSPAAACFREGTSLEWPLSDLEPFLFIARSALERLCRRLESRGLACARLGLSLDLDPRGRIEHSLRLPAPTRDVKSLLTLLRLRLEEQPPGAAVGGFALLAHPDRSPETQLSLFGPDSMSPGRLAATLARLFHLLGPDRMGSPRLADTHRPEGFRLVDFTPPPPPEISPPPSPAGGRGLLAVRLLRPPVHLDVLTDASQSDARPVRIDVHGVRNGRPDRTQPRIRGRVRVAAGPWSLRETWWSEEAVEREYWDVELSDGGLYRLYRHPVSGDWYADGIYD